MAYDGSLIFDTKIDKKGFEKGVSGLKSVAKTSMGIVTGLMKVAAVAIVGIGAASIKAGSTFEAGMSQVAATMGITVDEIQKGDKSFQMLEKAALDMGKATQFSASDASEALNYLALAGYDAEKAVGALPKVLNLAAAGGLELGYASDLVTDSMSALGLETKELDKFVDQLAKTSQKSNTNVAQLGEAILTVGGTAKILKGGTVELNTQLGILADNGIKGSEGGTALRNVLLALSAPTDKQAEAMKGLGVETYDANGNLRSTDDIFQDLDSTLGEMTDKERTEVLAKLFNKVDLKAANALLAGSGDRFKELSTSIERSEGAAASMAETLNDNLLGKIELLKSAMEYLGIVIYKSVDSPIKGVVETFAGYIDKISSVLTAHEDIKASAEELGVSVEDLGINLADVPNGFEGAAVIIGEILADMIVKFAEFAPKMLEMGVKLITALLDGIKQNLPQIAAAALEVIKGFVMAFIEILPQIYILGIELITSLVQGIAEMLPALIPVMMEAGATILNTILESLPLILQAGVEILFALVDGILGSIETLIPIGIEIMTTILDKIIENLPLILAAGVAILVALIESLIENMPLLITTALEIITLICDALIDNLPLLIQAGIGLIMALTQGIIDNIDLLIVVVPRLINEFANAIYAALPKILLAGIKIIWELIKGLIQAIPTLIANIPAIIMAVVNVFTLYNWWNLGKSVITKLGTGISSMVGNIGTIAKNIATNVINAIKGIFTGAPAVGSGFIRGIISGISSLASSLISSGRTMAVGALNAIKGAFANAPSIGSNMVKGIWNGISNVTGWILSKIQGFGSSVMKGIKKIFGIKSPSTVMRDQIGKNLALGLGVGIEKEMPSLQRDIDKEMSKLTAGMKSTVDMESSILGNGMVAGNKDMKYTVVNSIKDAKDKLSDILISGNNFTIREDADITKVARELHNLQLRKARG